MWKFRGTRSEPEPVSWARRPRLGPNHVAHEPGVLVFRLRSRRHRTRGDGRVGKLPNYVVALAAVPDLDARPFGTRPFRSGCPRTCCGPDSAPAVVKISRNVDMSCILSVLPNLAPAVQRGGTYAGAFSLSTAAITGGWSLRKIDWRPFARDQPGRGGKAPRSRADGRSERSTSDHMAVIAASRGSDDSATDSTTRSICSLCPAFVDHGHSGRVDLMSPPFWLRFAAVALGQAVAHQLWCSHNNCSWCARAEVGV